MTVSKISFCFVLLLCISAKSDAKKIIEPTVFEENILSKHDKTGELYKAITGQSKEPTLKGITPQSMVKMNKGSDITLLNFSIYFLKAKPKENVWAALMKNDAAIDTMPEVDYYNTKLGDKGLDNGGQDPYTDPLFLAAVVGDKDILDAFIRRGRTFKWMEPAHFLYILDGADSIRDEEKKATFKRQLFLLTQRDNAIEITLYLQEKLDSGAIEEMGGTTMWGHVISFLKESIPPKEVAAYVAKGIKLKIQQTAQGALDTLSGLGKSLYKRMPSIR